MAAVIRYLSADNHSADTPFNSPETGRHSATMSLYPRTCLLNDGPFYISVYILCVCAWVCMCVEVLWIYSSKCSKKYSCSPIFRIYIYIAFTRSLWTIKTSFNASGKLNPVGYSHCTLSQSLFNNITARKSFGSNYNQTNGQKSILFLHITVCATHTISMM